MGTPVGAVDNVGGDDPDIVGRKLTVGPKDGMPVGVVENVGNNEGLPLGTSLPGEGRLDGDGVGAFGSATGSVSKL